MVERNSNLANIIDICVNTYLDMFERCLRNVNIIYNIVTDYFITFIILFHNTLVLFSVLIVTTLCYQLYVIAYILETIVNSLSIWPNNLFLLIFTIHYMNTQYIEKKIMYKTVFVSNNSDTLYSNSDTLYNNTLVNNDYITVVDFYNNSYQY